MVLDPFSGFLASHPAPLSSLQEYHRKLKKAEKRKAGADGEEAGDEEALQRMQEDAEFERAKVGWECSGRLIAGPICCRLSAVLPVQSCSSGPHIARLVLYQTSAGVADAEAQEHTSRCLSPLALLFLMHRSG